MTHAERIILKHPLNLGVTTIDCPLDTRTLTVQTQRGALVVWVSSAVDKPVDSKRQFLTIGTGVPYLERNRPDGTALETIGTVQQIDGALVWHVFEIVPGRVDGK